MQVDLLTIYNTLLNCLGKQHWWPAKTRFEVIVGAILTQNTAWQNVEKVIENLDAKGILTPEGIFNAEEEVLEECIRPVGYFKVKTARLKNFMEFLFNAYEGDIQRMFSTSSHELREQLLKVKGIGPETADSIMLYAGDKLTFVVDAYTRRIFSRIGMIDKNLSYEEIKDFFERNLPEDLELYNEFHALIVKLGKEYCRTAPLCERCPLARICNYNPPRPA